VDCLGGLSCDMISGMADTDFSLLDVPRSVPVHDPEAYLHAAIAWHFSEDTGCTFWLRTASTLNFKPLTDVNTFTDLQLFPNLVNELRSVPVEDLIPRGYGSPPPLPQIFESGGTSGAPKRTVQLPDWIDQVVEWQTADFDALPVCRLPSSASRRRCMFHAPSALNGPHIRCRWRSVKPRWQMPPMVSLPG
jgi:hypothetical protein